jgi:hypothetical protein
LKQHVASIIRIIHAFDMFAMTGQFLIIPLNADNQKIVLNHLNKSSVLIVAALDRLLKFLQKPINYNRLRSYGKTSKMFIFASIKNVSIRLGDPGDN